MNENIDLTKILKNCPKGTKFYSSIYGDLYYESIYISSSASTIYFTDHSSRSIVSGEYLLIEYRRNGRIYPLKGECTLFPSKEQRDWSKFTAPWYNKESIKPKFKVGDKIRHKETNKDDVYEISKVYDDSYGIVGFNWMIYMKYQDQYELVPNKFYPKNLIPFDKVLVRDSRLVSDSPSSWWRCQIFSFISEEDKDYPYVCIGESYSYCIPYNDDTKHLVGTNKEEPEYYRYWED